MPDRDYYEILGVSKTASADEIKAAHRRLVRKLHPDVNTTDASASRKFEEVQEAYDTLSDPEKRKQYDQFGRAGPLPQDFPPYGGGGARGSYGWDADGGQTHVEEIDPNDFGPGGHFGDIFDQLFGRGGPFKRGRPTGGRSSVTQDYEAAVPSEIEYPAKLGFEQAARGTTLPITITRGNRSETIDVKIPAGVKTGSRVRIKGRGSVGPNGPGDLFIIVQVVDHPYYRRDGLDVLLDVPVSLYESLLGTKVQVPTLDGRVTITIPPGTNSGAKLRIKGAGVHRGADKGDQYCVVKIVLPKQLDETDRAMIDAIRLKHPINARDGLPW